MVHPCETRLSVMDTEAGFYTRVVGLKFAYRGTRDVVFLWASEDRRSMVGLWGPGHDLRWQLPRVAHRFRCESV